MIKLTGKIFGINGFWNLVLLLNMILSVQVCAQSNTEKLKEIYRDGDEFFQDEDYKEALYYFLQLPNQGFINANLQYKIGVCYLNLSGQEVKAVPYLESAAKRISLKYKAKNIDEKSAPLHTLFYLGKVYRIDNQLTNALRAYKKFYNNPEFEEFYNSKIVEREIESCEEAKIIQDSPVQVAWQNLGIPVNSDQPETHPVVSGNDSVLVYLFPLKFYNALYCTHKVDGKWQQPENIIPQVMVDGDYYPTALSYDGKELFLVKKNGSNYDIFMSHFAEGKWSPVCLLNKNVNSTKDETYASISKDGKVLYYSSNRRESKGGFDIFYSEKGPDGEWGPAQNLGKTINTREDEVAPSIAADGKTLYFSSKGHFNMGGFDIFVSIQSNDKTWSEPRNIGYPINTTNDNLGFQVVGDGKTGYLARIMPEGLGMADIYKLEIRSDFVPKRKLKKRE